MPDANDALSTSATTATATIPAVLEGGPTDLPPAARTLRVPAEDQKVKIAHRGGYEHFERADRPHPEGASVVFRWTTRTKVAE